METIGVLISNERNSSVQARHNLKKLTDMIEYYCSKIMTSDECYGYDSAKKQIKRTDVAWLCSSKKSVQRESNTNKGSEELTIGIRPC